MALTLGLSPLMPVYGDSPAEQIEKPSIQRSKYSYQSKHIKSSDQPKDKDYDVIVFGSDPEAIAAAYSAGKQGLKTLLVDFGRDRVGGLYTLGWLNMLDFNYAPGEDDWYQTVYKDNFLNHGVFERFYNMIGGKKAFDIGDAQEAFEKLLQGAQVEVVLTSDPSFDYSYSKEEKTSHITINKDSGANQLTAKVVIDATPNGDIALRAGAQFKEGKEDVGLKGVYQSATLVYKIKGVDWDQVRQELLVNDKDPDTGVNQNAAWGYKQMLKAPVNHPKMQSRHLNLGRQKDGTVVVNAFQIFDFKPYDQAYQAEIKKEATKRIKEDIIPYMRKNLKGFEKAEFVSVAPEFYIRETKHMIGEETLTANDVFDSVYPDNFIASGSYPIDIQALQKGDLGTILTGTKPYGVAAGVMVPKGIEGIYVPSKVASMDSIAYGSARTVPVLMAMGEAAGVMAKVAIDMDVSTAKIHQDPQLLLKVRARMYDQGVRLVSYENKHSIDQSYAAKEIKELRGKALITMTYQNEYGLSEKATVKSMETMAHLMENNAAYKISKKEIMNILKDKDNQQLTLKDMIKVLNYFTGNDYKTLENYKTNEMIPENIYQEIMKKAVEIGEKGQVIGPVGTAQQKGIAEAVTTDAKLTNEDLYALMGNIIKFTALKE